MKDEPTGGFGTSDAGESARRGLRALQGGARDTLGGVLLYTSPEEEAGALRRAAARVGCKLKALEMQPRAGRLRPVASLECADGWQAARLVLALASEDARTVGARELAADVTAGARSDLEAASAIHAFVRRNVRFVPDIGEVFSGPAYALELGEGDCEDQARIVYALAQAAGIPARMAFLHRLPWSPPTHAVAQLLIDGRPVWAETTIAAELGEEPNAAARRLGVVNDRSDISEGVKVMSERDLSALPPRFLDVNDPAQIKLDSGALVRLGYLAPEHAENVDPASHCFRLAVRGFQRDARITPDGLTGPQTRRTIAGALPVGDELAAAYVAATAISAIGAVTSSRLTAHLSPEFFRRTEEMSARFRSKGAEIHAEDFLAAWNVESGIGRHKQGHGGLPYYGINMMMSSLLPNVGWAGTPEEYRALSPADQVRYVERYYELNVRAFLGGDWSKLRTPTALYLMNFLPKYTKEAGNPAYVLTKPGDGTTFYKSNRGFDRDNKGWIEVGDLTKAMERAKVAAPAYWSEVTSRQRTEGGSLPPSSAAGIGGGAIVAGVALLLAVGGAVLANR